MNAHPFTGVALNHLNQLALETREAQRQGLIDDLRATELLALWNFARMMVGNGAERSGTPAQSDLPVGAHGGEAPAPLDLAETRVLR